MNTPPFRYEGYQIDPDRGLLTCRYSVGDYRFSERVTVSGAAPERWARADAAEAARLGFLLAGVSSYKTAAPPFIDLGVPARVLHRRTGRVRLPQRPGPVRAPDRGPVPS